MTKFKIHYYLSFSGVTYNSKETLCGLNTRLYLDIPITHEWSKVTCKTCLRLKKQTLEPGSKR